MDTRFRSCRLGRPWTEAVTLLPEEYDLVIRPIRPDDAPQLRAAYQHLTPEDIRFRFLHMVNEITPAVARSLAQIDPAREFALVVAEPGPPGKAAIAGVARAAIASGSRESEFAIIIGEPLRGHGLAVHLMRKIIEWSRKKRLDAVYGDVLPDNTAMLELATHLGFKRYSSGEPGLLRVRLRLK